MKRIGGLTGNMKDNIKNYRLLLDRSVWCSSGEGDHQSRASPDIRVGAIAFSKRDATRRSSVSLRQARIAKQIAVE
jgi:hypothetical protein